MKFDWSVDSLTVLSDETLLERTRLAAGSLAVGRLYLGRCLLALEARHLSWRRGYSSAVHLAQTLGVSGRTAREARRVANELEYLPRLRAAAEAGSIQWTSLRSVVSKATEETEEQWLELCASLTPDAVEAVVARTEEGEEPNLQPDSPPQPVWVKLTFTVSPEVAEVFEETVQALSREAGRMVPVTDVFVSIVAEARVGRGPEAWEQVLQEARRRVAARESAVLTPYAVLAAEEADVPEEPDLKMVRPLRFSGTARIATPAQREYLLRRDGYGCMTPGCENRIWMHVHHIAFYCQGGVTLPSNLVVLCSRCHKNVHEGWLRVRTGPRFSDADGKRLEDWDLGGTLLLDTG